MTDQTLSDWLYDIAVKYDFSSDGTKDTSPVRPPEVISGASGFQVSTGENTDQSVMEGGDLAESTRANAEENDRKYVGSTYEDSSYPMQSPNLAHSSDFELRYGIGFLCMDYPGDDEDLDGIKELTGPTSAYLAAFRGMDETEQYENPTSSEIVSRIHTWVVKLAKDLKGHGQGELVVSFQGHGSKGHIYGVDDVIISSGKLLSIAKKATEARVSITYVMDACFSGNAVPRFQDNAANELEERIENEVEGAGNVCSAENTARANELRDQMAHARELIMASAVVGRLGNLASDWFDEIEEKNDAAAWDGLIDINMQLIEKIEGLQRQFVRNMDFAATTGMRFDEVERVFPSTLRYLRGIQPHTSFNVDEWSSTVGNFQDTISDGANRVIRIVNAELA